MPLNDGLPRPDLASEQEARSLAWPEVVRRLTGICRKETHRLHCGHKRCVHA
jgi:hypothetical protein